MDSRQILNTLKLVLRKKKITYNTLSIHLKLSEAGVKKMFTTGDMSLNRMMQICEFIDIFLEDLILASKNHPVKKLKLNKEQVAFFSKYPDYFFFFLKLSHERCTVQTIAEENNLSKKSIWKYLKKLDDLALIKLHSNDEVKHLYSLPLTIDAEGKFFHNLKVQMAQNFLKGFQMGHQKHSNLALTLFSLSTENTDQLKKDLESLRVTYQRKSEVDKTILSVNDLTDFSLLLAHSATSFIPTIKQL